MGTISVDELLDIVVETAVKQFRQPTHPPEEPFSRFVRQDVLDFDTFSKNRMRQAGINEIESVLNSLQGDGARTHVNLASLGETVLANIKVEGSKLGARLGLEPEEIVPSMIKSEFLDAVREAADRDGLDIEGDLALIANKLPERVTGNKDMSSAIVAAFGSDYWGDLDDINADAIVAQPLAQAKPR